MIKIRTYKITENTAGFCDIIDITAKFRQHLAKENIQNGLATLFVSGSTAALTTIEHEPGLIQDLKSSSKKSFLPIGAIITTTAGATITVFLILRASLFGPSLAIPIEHGQLCLGTWQQIVLLDFDNRARTREITVQLMGESE